MNILFIFCILQAIEHQAEKTFHENNQPVTQREVPFPPNSYLVSRTDLKGIIKSTKTEETPVEAGTDAVPYAL